MNAPETTAGERPSLATHADPERWVDEHGDCLYRYALTRVRKEEIAEDLVQETLLVAVRTHERFAGRSTERSWLVGILKNKICDHFRKLGRETEGRGKLEDREAGHAPDHPVSGGDLEAG